jgi:hypothetical protein
MAIVQNRTPKSDETAADSGAVVQNRTPAAAFAFDAEPQLRSPASLAHALLLVAAGVMDEDDAKAVDRLACQIADEVAALEKAREAVAVKV